MHFYNIYGLLILSFMMHGIQTQGSIHKIFKRIHKIYNTIRTIKTIYETYNFKLKDLIKSKKKYSNFFFISKPMAHLTQSNRYIKVSFIIYYFLWNLPPCTRSFQIQFRTFIFSSIFKHWFSILLDKKNARGYSKNKFILYTNNN